MDFSKVKPSDNVEVDADPFTEFLRKNFNNDEFMMRGWLAKLRAIKKIDAINATDTESPAELKEAWKKEQIDHFKQSLRQSILDWHKGRAQFIKDSYFKR